MGVSRLPLRGCRARGTSPTRLCCPSSSCLGPFSSPSSYASSGTAASWVARCVAGRVGAWGGSVGLPQFLLSPPGSAPEWGCAFSQSARGPEPSPCSPPPCLKPQRSVIRRGMPSWAGPTPVGSKGTGQGTPGSCLDASKIGVLSPRAPLLTLTTVLLRLLYPDWPLSRLAASSGTSASPSPFW